MVSRAEPAIIEELKIFLKQLYLMIGKIIKLIEYLRKIEERASGSFFLNLWKMRNFYLSVLVSLLIYDKISSVPFSRNSNLLSALEYESSSKVMKLLIREYLQSISI